MDKEIDEVYVANLQYLILDAQSRYQNTDSWNGLLSIGRANWLDLPCKTVKGHKNGYALKTTRKK